MNAPSESITAAVSGGKVLLASGSHQATLHPLWLRHRSTEPNDMEPSSRQRLFTPRDISLDLVVTQAFTSTTGLHVEFSDGCKTTLELEGIKRALDWADDPEEPPSPLPWSAPLAEFPYVDWREIGWSSNEAEPSAVLSYLTSFFRYGYVVFRNTPTEVGTVRRICDRLGYISGNNFGWVFDVRTEAQPADLAYTSIELLAHTDQPYRQPTPGIQLLHCLENGAPGGDSTLVDGLAAAQALRSADFDAWKACVETDTIFRYDTGADTVVGRGRLLHYDQTGCFRQVRLNTKIDEPVLKDSADLSAYYRGRRLLTEWCNDPAHQVTFRLEPGDVMFMDNLRVLHGRTAFDPTKGNRHLQGAYIDHDGPDTMYRLAVRSNNSPQLPVGES